MNVPTETTSGRFYYGWIVVLVCMIVMTLAAPLLASFSVFYVALLKDLNWHRGETALAMAIFLVVNGLTGPFAGGLIDRLTPKWVMPIGTLITAGALVWMSQMTTRWEFYIAYGVIASAGSAMIHIVPFAAIVSNWFVRYRGLAIGAVTAGMGLGQGAIPLIQYLIDHIGWRKTYLVIGGAVFVIPTALILLFLESRPEARGMSVDEERLPWRTRPRAPQSAEGGMPKPDEAAPVDRNREYLIIDREWAETDWTVGRAARTGRFWALTLLIALFGIGFMTMNVQLVAFLEEKGYSSVLAASAVGLQGMVYIIGRFLGGGLSDRIGREKAVTLSALIFILFLVLLYSAGITSSPLLVYAAVTLFGLGGGMPLPALMAATGDIFQGKHLGAIIGVVMLGGFVGGGLGAWLGGYLFDLTHSYDANFILTILVIVASGVLIWKASPSEVRMIRPESAALGAI